MSAIAVTQNTFQSEVLDSKLPVLVDFWAPWCGPCRMLSPIIDEIAAEHPSHLKVAKVNVDEESALATQFNVMSIPMLALIQDGRVVDTSIGAKPKGAVLEHKEEKSITKSGFVRVMICSMTRVPSALVLMTALARSSVCTCIMLEDTVEAAWKTPLMTPKYFSAISHT